MNTEDLDYLIERVETGQETRLIMPSGFVKTLGEHDLDDLYLAREVNKLLSDALPALEALL